MITIDKRKTHITATIRPELARLVEVQRQGRGMTRSGVVSEALEEWLERREAEDRGELRAAERSSGATEIAEQLGRGIERLAALSLDNRRATEMVYALLQQSVRNAGEADRQKVRLRAIENMRADRRQKEERAGAEGVAEGGGEPVEGREDGEWII